MIYWRGSMNNFNLSHIKDLISTKVHQPTGNAFLDARFDDHVQRFNTPWWYYRLFYHLAKELEPGSIVVELGGYQGTAAAHFKGGNPQVNVISVDHHTDPGDELNQEKMNEAVNEMGILYFQGWSTDYLANEQKGYHALRDAPSAFPLIERFLVGSRGIDILFIDSWHNYQYAMMDWQAYRPLLASPALVICDDITGEEAPTISGMLRFWDELPGEKFLNFTLHPGTGMGFLIYESAQ